MIDTLALSLFRVGVPAAAGAVMSLTPPCPPCARAQTALHNVLNSGSFPTVQANIRAFSIKASFRVAMITIARNYRRVGRHGQHLLQRLVCGAHVSFDRTRARAFVSYQTGAGRVVCTRRFRRSSLIVV